jgi:hypothetical protein
MTSLRGDIAPPAQARRGGFRGWLRHGGWLLCAAGVAVSAVFSTTIDLPPRYDALARPVASTDALPPAFPELLAAEIAAGSSRLLGTDGETAYYLAAPAEVASGVCFVAANLVDSDLSQAGCSSPGLGAGFQFADVALSNHRPGDSWVEIAEDVWRDTEYEELQTAR